MAVILIEDPCSGLGVKGKKEWEYQMQIK